MLELIREYFANPLSHCDMSSARFSRREKATIIERKPLDEVIGCYPLGSGHFSTVYPLDADRVVKLTLHHSDEAYKSYVEWAQQHQDNPWVPRIYETFNLGHGTMMYVLERLGEARVGHDYVEKLYECIADPDKAECEHLKALLVGFGTMNFNDVARRNMMQRADGQLVMTDPCSSFFGVGKCHEPRRREAAVPRFLLDDRVFDWGRVPHFPAAVPHAFDWGAPAVPAEPAKPARQNKPGAPLEILARNEHFIQRRFRK